MELTKKLQSQITKLFGKIRASEADSFVNIGREELQRLAKGLGISVLSFVLGSSGGIFQCYPFGIAFLSAADSYIGYIAAGLVLSSLWSPGLALSLILSYVLIPPMRTALGRLASKRESSSQKGRNAEAAQVKPFCESILLRCTVSCFTAFVLGLYRLVSGGFLYFDLFGLLSGFLICPMLTLGLSGLFMKRSPLSKYREISMSLLMFILIYSLKGITLLGFSPGLMAAVFAALWTASTAGGLRACAIGLVAGLACGEPYFMTDAGGFFTYSVGAAPCIAACVGLTAGLMWKYSKLTAAAAGGAAGILIGISADGFDVMQRLMPDILCASVIFMPLSHYSLLPGLAVLTGRTTAVTVDEALMLEKKQKDTALRMSSISEALGRLSDVIYSLSDRLRRPGILDLKRVCDSSFDRYCSKCSLASLCLERECTSTLDAQSKLTTGLHLNGRLELADVPEYLRERCCSIERIVSEINLGCAELVERLIKDDRTETFAIDYDALSKLLAEAVTTSEAEYMIDGELTKKLSRSLKYMGMPEAGILCFGQRRKQIMISGVELAGMRMGAAELQRAIENTTGIRMSAPSFSIEDERVSMSLSARRRFSVEYAKASGKKENESANGDTAEVFENREDYFYTLISDGMGSGREAAITSKLCSVFCEQMLSGGNSKAVTLEMLNGFIRSKGGECSATIDLMEADLITGEACFVKSGAAPSFVMREKNLYKLQSKTLPIGILQTLDAERIRFDLTHGDVIIMLSDGVAESLEDGIWLANLVTYEWEDDLQRMAEKIIDNAALNNMRSDDMTVVLIRISEDAGE